jgi:N-acyl-D-aspartate/D-glutamate deacylase
MQHAIRAATSLPAKMIGLNGRGQIKEGYIADIVIFNTKTIDGIASFEDPHQYSKGIAHLLIGGQSVIENDQYNGTLVGKTLKMNEYRK